MKIRNVFLSLLAVALLWSCGKDEDPAPPKNNAPVIAAKTFTVAENITPGTAIGTVTATDADKDALTFSIKTNDNNLFAITKAGTLSLASGKTLSFATKAQHVITVAVTDGEASASAKVTINVTQVDPENQSPTMEPQGFETVESIDDATEIGVVNATDPEGDELVFTIVANDNDLFEISAKGALTLAAGKQLDFGTAQEHTITVGVTDGNTAATADITITVTQDPLPTGDPQNFEADENIADTEVIGTVLAEDPDGQPLTFSITTNDNDLFEITEGGELSLADGMALDFETQDQHDIVVNVSDGYNSIDINVSIKVLDDGVLADDTTSFVTTWTIPNDNFNLQIYLPASGYDFTIDWGDGLIEQIIADSGIINHDYAMAGEYTMAIKGVFPSIKMGHPFIPVESKAALSSIEQWGNISWTSFLTSFSNCENMVYNATDNPDLSNVTTMAYMFNNCLSFNGDLSGWVVSNITDMEGAFSHAESFNGDISNWDVSNVTNMSNMFIGAIAFNGDLNNWDVSNVTDLSFMFSSASAFNQDIGGWNVSNVTEFDGMFSAAASFNADISGWTPINATTMNNMFKYATSFNQDIGNWNVSNVTSMVGMFYGATSFNQDVGNWDVINVTDMFRMFLDASAFDQNLAAWDIGNVTEMGFMLNNSGMSPENLNATLIGWNDYVETNNGPDGITLGLDNLAFCGQEAIDAANNLDQIHGWTFTGTFFVEPVCP